MFSILIVYIIDIFQLEYWKILLFQNNAFRLEYISLLLSTLEKTREVMFTFSFFFFKLYVL